MLQAMIYNLLLCLFTIPLDSNNQQERHLLLYTIVRTGGYNNHTCVSSSAAIKSDDKDEEPLISNIRQLTLDGRRSGEGYFNDDGSMMIFQSEREKENPFFQIYLLDLSNNNIRRLSPGYGKSTCGWINPGSTAVIFASTHLDQKWNIKKEKEFEFRASGRKKRYAWDFDEHYDIFWLDLKTQRIQNLTKTYGYDAECAISPDGKFIVFASNRRAYKEKLLDSTHTPSYFIDIYIMKTDGTDVRQLTDSGGYDGGPFFSPDGKRIVWRRFAEDGRSAEIYQMNTDGSDQKQITSANVISWAPFFHPSGRYLIYSANTEGFGNFELYIIDVNGKSKPIRVTNSDGFDGLAVFSPDGTKLSWTSSRTRDGKTQIYIADWDNAKALELLKSADNRKE